MWFDNFTFLMVARGGTSIPPGIQVEWAKGVRENEHSVIIYVPQPILAGEFGQWPSFCFCMAEKAVVPPTGKVQFLYGRKSDFPSTGKVRLLLRRHVVIASMFIQVCLYYVISSMFIQVCLYYHMSSQQQSHGFRSNQGLWSRTFDSVCYIT